MPRFKRKRWVRFVKKVKAVENSTIGTRTRVFNNLLNYSDGTGPDGQLFKSVALYSNASATNNQDDLLKIMDEDPDIANSGKIQMISGIMDMTLVNRSVDGVSAGMGVELDVYLLTAKKRFEYKDAAGALQSGNIEDVLADGNATAGIIGQNRVGITNRGATPFDFTTALSSFGIKVLSKKKYFLPPGNQMTYQIRDPKNHQFLKDDVRNIQGQNKPGATKLLLIVAKGLPGAQAGDNYSIFLNVGITRKYAYKINEDDEDMTGFKS
jgi:hypothetical protein